MDYHEVGNPYTMGSTIEREPFAGLLDPRAIAFSGINGNKYEMPSEAS
jgi:hypothetical protein